MILKGTCPSLKFRNICPTRWHKKIPILENCGKSRNKILVPPQVLPWNFVCRYCRHWPQSYRGKVLPQKDKLTKIILASESEWKTTVRFRNLCWISAFDKSETMNYTYYFWNSREEFSFKFQGKSEYTSASQFITPKARSISKLNEIIARLLDEELAQGMRSEIWTPSLQVHC